MRILYLHQYYRSLEQGGPVRSAYLAKALAKANHEVVLISCHKYAKKVQLHPDGYKLILLQIPYENTYGWIRRIAAWYRFVMQAKREIHKLGHFDLVYASSTPLTIGHLALWIKRKYQFPYIFELRDVWPEVPYLTGYLKPYFLYRLIVHWVSSVYRESIGLVVLSPNSARYIIESYESVNLLHTSNMCDIDYYRPSTHKEIGNCLRLVYLGSLGKSSGLNSLLAKVATWHKAGWNIELHIAGEGFFAREVKNAANSSKNIVYHGLLNRSECRDLLHLSHVGVVWFEEKEAFEWNSPNKYFDYLAAGLPVWSNLPNAWYSQMAMQYGCLVSEKTLVELINNKVGYVGMQLSAIRLAKEVFEREKLCSEWVHTLEEWTKAYTLKQEITS